MLKTTVNIVSIFSLVILTVVNGEIKAQTITSRIDFTDKIRNWDGFGVNYVETSQTYDYFEYPQDYGGFSILEDEDKAEILRLIFGEEGLKVNLVKMFLDPLHQNVEDGSYDHETSTENMRFFVRKGTEISEERGQDLSIITTLYSPPGYMTVQGTIRGRDLDPDHEDDLIKYFIDWSQYLVENDYPLKFISIHNEGESWLRWPESGKAANTISEAGHDYNLFWTPKQVSNFIIKLRSALDTSKLNDVGITNGEPTNWYRFGYWGYADALADNEQALDALSIITSHGFYVGDQHKGRWFGPHSSYGTDQVRNQKPEIHAWATSSSWDEKMPVCTEDGEIGKEYVMDAGFVKQIHGNIYEAKINGFIPWAVIQRAAHWQNPDPNPGSAFRVYEDGSWELKKAYYYYKQVTRAGQPGMSVVRTFSMDTEIALIGFASNGTQNANSFVLINFGDKQKDVKITINGNKEDFFDAFRTSGQEVYRRYNSAKNELMGENFVSIGSFQLNEGQSFLYTAPANSVTTFFEKTKPFN